jgi:hypothetical protein
VLSPAHGRARLRKRQERPPVVATAPATRRACAQPSELVTTAGRSTGRPGERGGDLHDDVNDAVAHAAGDKPFTLTVTRPSRPALACYLTCRPFSLDAETLQAQSIPATGQLADCFRPGVNNPVCNDLGYLRICRTPARAAAEHDRGQSTVLVEQTQEEDHDPRGQADAGGDR